MPDTTKGAWRLQEVRDQIITGNWPYITGGTLWTWGLNAQGSLGLNDENRRSSPVQVPGTQWAPRRFCPSSTNYYGVILIKNDNTLWGIGRNNNGELGVNNRTYYSSPVQIPGTEWIQVSNGGHTLAIKKDNTLWAWGSSEGGKSGLNATGAGAHRSSPSQIPGTQWVCVSAGRSHSLALKTDNTLWGWGGSYCGAAGLNISVSVSSPTQIPGTQWCSISAGWCTGAALKTDGTLWVWGTQRGGALGNNINDNYAAISSPIQLPGTQWVEVSIRGRGANYSTGFGRKSDGTLWGWGSNDFGSIGVNNITSYSSPVQIPGTQWVGISNEIPVLARKSDGTLWGWGCNNNGHLGDNSIVTRSSPIQIPGTQWIDVVNTGINTYAIKAC